MKKIKWIVSIFLVLAFACPSFAAVGIDINGQKSTATDIKFGGGATTNGSTVTFPLLIAGTANGGATSMTTSETAVPTSYSLVRKAMSVAGQAGTLANGNPGQILTIFITAVSGSGTFVLTPTTKTGYTTLTFDAAKDQVTLLFVDSTVGWIVIGNVSVTVAIP